MLDRVDSENSKNSAADTDELKRLEALIKKSDAELKTLTAKLEDLEKEIRRKENNKSQPKILTRKEIKELNLKREKAKEEKLKELKNNIDIITRSEFERAKIIRVKAENFSVSEKKVLMIQAVQVEIDALKKELEIKGTILYDNQERARDLLAEKVFEELKISKLKKEINKLKVSKKEYSFGSDIKDKLNHMISRKNSLTYDYEKTAGEIETINLRMKKAKKLLESKLTELESLK